LIQKPEEPSKDNAPTVETRHRLVSTISDLNTLGQNRFNNPPKHTLSSIIGSYKSVVTKSARKILGDFAWQAGFHDHIIRNQVSHGRIEDYILNNPTFWEQDKFYG
jgi:hypothetical protein